MKAVGYINPQEIENSDALIDIELPVPQASGKDLLVKILAIAVNPVDTKVRKNSKPQNKHHKILGWDAVGEVIATGESVSYFKTGDKVWYSGDLTRSGSNAEYQLVDERIAAKKPLSISNAEAAALPLTTITAWELLFDRLGFIAKTINSTAKTQTAETLIKNENQILIVGAAGGVGSILTQLAKQLTSATVIGTASRTDSQKWVKSLGADHVINHHQAMLPQLVNLGIESVSHVISLTHTDQHFEQLVDILAPQGKLALIDDPDEGLINIKKLKMKSLSLHWEFMFTRSMFNTHDMQKQHELLTAVSDLIDQGLIKTTLGEHFGTINAKNLKRAHRHIEKQQTIGKIVLEGFGD